MPDDPALQHLLAAHRVERLAGRDCGGIVIRPVTQLEIASSDIRARASAGRSIDFLVPPAVAQLVRRHALYR